MGQVTNIWPHDLLTFASNDDLILEKNPLPEWAKDSLSKAKIVVVRRGLIKDDLIPVGLRGYERNQRLAGFLPKAKIVQQYHPDYFIKHQSWQKLPADRQALTPFKALAVLSDSLKNYHWGISGSLAYEMATHVKMVKELPEHVSDLDLIMPNLPKMTVQAAGDFLHDLNQFGVHADMQIVHEQRGFSLEEYALNPGRKILLKTATGPILVKDPFVAINEE
ncbi:MULTISPECIES: malonate decarboxylase holo-ACP synthase [Lactobacillus]|uniref:Malonate decarboxylase holo-ACP synthase n=1 Tax=Lactobacillus xujianguonis TaxID=2495899 RepID=A0A437SV64_9LACO|nr:MULTISPECIES: malonate decarboxylase holo-ACP synthase [Lactobacillus]RVU70772.1 malonate decarboxylase holo-ACP synthase [Lactobacillus xujianguonis]RVU73965.1 malonate decarboxylase holo-ACP synthase [Lactobacillus xujianguonis]